MFRGANALNLDTKGRLAIPAIYRRGLAECCNSKMVVTVNNTQEKCLWLYPLDQWEIVEQKVAALSSFDPNHQKLKRFLLGYASDVALDKSGRILLSCPLREFAGLDKEIMLVGQSNKFEIWDQSLWNVGCGRWLEAALDRQKMSVEMEQLSL